MPSSTSSSERGIWPRSWLAVLVVALLCLSAWEFGWRSMGFEPTLSDDAMLWSIVRGTASDGGSEAVVLVGSSRMQMDIHRETLAAATGWRPAVQLSLVRGPSRPVLANLASDESFRGTVLCEINPSLFYSDVSGFESEVEDYIAAYEGFTIFDRLEERLAMVVQGNLVTRLPQLRPTEIRRAVLLGHPPVPRYQGSIGADRYRYADYRKVPNISILNRMIGRQLANSDPRVLARDVFAKRVEETHRLADRIADRGGRVVFVRLPSAGPVMRREEQRWPRAHWWQEFARPAGKTARHLVIHFLDEPSLARFSPQDGDHLGKLHAIAFSRSLAQLLVRRL